VTPRHPNYFQDRVFHDREAWQQVGNKGQFVADTVFGSVWTSLLDRVAIDGRVTVRRKDVKSVRFLDPRKTTRPATIVLDPFNAKKDKALSFVVDARGPRTDWFMSQPFMAGRLLADLPSTAAALSKSLGADLAVSAPNVPPGLHLPMLGTEVSPAAANLMALGWVADSIIGPYV
jgi:hypothetical protein